MSRNRSNVRNRKPYGLFRFLWDILLGIVTCGLWWCFLLLRAIRGRN